MRTYYVYIMASRSGTLYIGITNNLERRVIEHKYGFKKCFTKKYSVNKLVYFETFGCIYTAIAKEKMLKGWVRQKKEALIRGFNPNWKDLGRDFKLV
ncbi:GIY-YIG nuclease family protein [Candidatus Margulisiibacteriota bacterium]